MYFLLGVFIVACSVVLGYTMHHGELSLLWQPNELVIIMGAGIGGLLIANPAQSIKQAIASLSYLFKGKPHTKQEYLEMLLFFFNTFKLMKVKGHLEIENHIESPKDSNLFSQAPSLLNNPTTLNFVRDNLRLITMGVEQPHQFEMMIDHEIDVFEHGARTPSKVYLILADALPALGIVAAVLGVIVTMRSILEPPEILGSLIAAALVGTFTGVLLSYGLFGPIGHFLTKYAEQRVKYLECIKAGFMGYLYGNPPIVVVEFIRKTIPEDVRPNFYEADAFINGKSFKNI